MTPLQQGSEASPYASVADTLVRNSFSAIPIKPAEKMPGAYNKGEWYAMRDWSRFCGRLPTEFELRLWKTWPDANVGLACGRGLLAFDIDRDDLVEPIKAVLPTVLVGKRGRKGETIFFRGDTDVIRSRGFSIDNLGCMDLISDGKQTVIPPSIHRDTGSPYVWTTARTLLDTTLDELPVIDESHVEAVIAVLRDFGYRTDDQTRFRPIEGGHGVELQDGASAAAEFFRTLNEDALGNLHAWVPRLGLQRLSRQGDHYRSVAEWRPSNSGSPLFKRPLLLSIHPKGIVDYGGQEKTYTPLNLVMAAHDLADYQLDKAAVWLGECIGYDFSAKIVLNRKRKAVPMATPEQAAALVREAGDDPEPESDGEGFSDAAFDELQRLRSKPLAPPTSVPGDDEARTANVVDIKTEFDPSTGEVFSSVPLDEVVDAGLTPEQHMEALTHVPGLVGDIVNWIEATSRFPSRTLALASALVFVGTLAGRIYKGEGGLRTNLYTLGLAPSGFGKDHARKCLNSLELAGGFKEYFGGDKIPSATGMRRRVEQHASIFWMIDEFGGFMKNITDPRSGQHTTQIRDNLLQYYATSSSVFRGADYAAERGSVCYHPNVGLYGTSTPIDFWGACRSLSVGDGLLARFLIFSTGSKGRPPRQRPTCDYESPPIALIEACRLVATAKCGGNLVRLMDGSRPSKPTVVHYSKGAEDFEDAMSDSFQAQADEASTEEQAFYQRVGENAVKIALILAIGVNPDRPILTVDLLIRGRDIAALCLKGTLGEIRGRLADNDRQREHIDVRRWIEEAGASGLSKTELSRRINGRFDARRRDDILRTLEQDERVVESRLTKSVRGGVAGCRFVALKHLGEKAQ